MRVTCDVACTVCSTVPEIFYGNLDSKGTRLTEASRYNVACKNEHTWLFKNLVKN